MGEKGILRVTYLSVAGFESARHDVFGYAAGSAKQKVSHGIVAVMRCLDGLRTFDRAG